MESNRWWEFYFIRYFVGSVTGSLVVLALAFHPDSSLAPVIADLFSFPQKDVLHLKAEHFWVILGFGVAFCYLASSPILVLHAFRSRIKFVRERPSIHFFLLILVSASTVAVALNIFKVSHNKILAMTPMILLTYFQGGIVVRSIKDSFQDVFKFYKEVASVRAGRGLRKKEYIESYRHLREHGNAFLIIFCEMILGVALFSCDGLHEALLVLIFWLAPTSIIWLLGTFLESKLSEI